MTPVKVKWIDSCSSNINWMMLDEIADNKDIEPVYITTYGFLIKEEEDYICVAQNYGTEPEQICNLMSIPRGCIKSIELLEPEKDNINIRRNWFEHLKKAWYNQGFIEGKYSENNKEDNK